MSRVKRNHYIPQCYLRGWELQHAEISRKIGVYFRDGTYQEKPIVRTAKLKNFYLPRLEAGLQKIESKYAEVLQKIKASSPLSPSDRRSLVKFVTTLIRRNPVGKERASRVLKKANPERREEAIRKFWAELEASREIDLLEKLIKGNAYEFFVRGRSARFEMGMPPEMFADLTLIDMPEYEDILQDLDWVFYTSGPRHPFVTSDNPVIMAGSGLVKDPNVVLPITSGICLLTKGTLSRSRATTKYEIASPSFVTRCNSMIVESADQEVYASRDCLSAQQLSKIGTRILVKD